MQKTFENKVVSISLLLLAIIGVSFALRQARELMVPFVLSIFLAILLSAAVEIIEERFKTPHWVALLITGFGVLIFAALVFVILASNISILVGNADEYQKHFVEFTEKVLAWAQKQGLQVDQKTILKGVTGLPVFGVLQASLAKFVDILTNGLLVSIFVVFLMTGPRPEATKKKVVQKIDRQIRTYVATKMISSSLTGVLVGAVLGFLGMDLALMFGFLSFLLNFIPNIGSIIAILLPLPVAFLQFESLWSVFWVLLIPGVIQFTVGNVLEPRFMGNSLGLHPAVILLSLMFWGMLWGAIGMFLAVPLMTVVKLYLERSEHSKFLAELLEGKP